LFRDCRLQARFCRGNQSLKLLQAASVIRYLRFKVGLAVFCDTTVLCQAPIQLGNQGFTHQAQELSDGAWRVEFRKMK